MTPGLGLVVLPAETSKPLPPHSPLHLRRLYGPNLDVPDGVLDDFPHNCVRDAGDSSQVWLPSRMCSAAVCTFLATAGSSGD
jgi:hypothetical protein